MGVTRAQWKVLFRLSRRPGLRQIELADMLDIEPITLSRIIDRLEEAGLVERVARSRRPAGMAASCHRTGTAARRETARGGGEMIADAFAGIDPKDIETTRAVLGRVRENATRAAPMQQGFEPMNKMQTEPMAGAEAAETPKRKRAKKADSRNWTKTIIMFIVPALLIIGGGYYWLTSGGSVSTDDSFVKQDIVSVSAQVTGPVEQVFVKNGSQVKRGDVLFKIDPAPFQVALENAQAQLAAAKLQTMQLRTQAAGTGADIVGEQANLAIKRNALARQQALLKQGFTTRASYEDALNEVKTAEQDVADARARAANAHAAIAPGEQPSIAQAQAAVDKAQLELSRTTVRAPMDGAVENADNLQVGQMAATGHRHAVARPQQDGLGRGELQGERRRAHGSWPARRNHCRRLSRPEIRGARAKHRRRHRQPVLAASGAERERQLGEGDAARAGTDRVQRHAVQADDCRTVGRRDRLLRLRQEVGPPMADTPAHIATHPLPSGQRLIVTVGVMAAVLLQVLDTTIANVALPHMQASLSASQDTINWVLTSYIVASAIALPISGWLADKVGRKRLLLISVVVFTVASVLCATATSLPEMVMFRAFQGVGGAFIVPLAQATLFDINPREKHGQAMALFGGGVMIGPILGPVLGGWLTDNYNWRWVFLVNLPVGILCILIMARFMPKTDTHERKFDMFGFALLAIALGGSAILPRPRRAEGLVFELGDRSSRRASRSAPAGCSWCI